MFLSKSPKNIFLFLGKFIVFGAMLLFLFALFYQASRRIPTPEKCTVTARYGSGFYRPGSVQYEVICPPGTKPVIGTKIELDPPGSRHPNNRPPEK